MERPPAPVGKLRTAKCSLLLGNLSFELAYRPLFCSIRSKDGALLREAEGTGNGSLDKPSPPGVKHGSLKCGDSEGPGAQIKQGDVLRWRLQPG